MPKLTAVQRAVSSGHQGGEAARLEAVQGGILRLQGVRNALSLHSRCPQCGRAAGHGHQRVGGPL